MNVFLKNLHVLVHLDQETCRFYGSVSLNVSEASLL